MIVPKLFRWILCLSLISASSLYAQQKFPVTTSTVLTPPYSTYLSDYFAPGSSALSCNFVFNDFREPTWQVRLRLKIESVDLKLETRPDYRPIAPIVVTPGVSTRLAGADLAEYFEFKNLIILGPAAQALQQNGRLPEGAYTFCIEVLDYPTGVLLSNTSCTTVWIKLNDPPRVISPLCGAYIDPYLPLNIPFQWQLANSISPNATQGTEFRLAVYELTDPYANPFTSIANAKVLRIFESEPQFQPSFIYTVAEPALDIGKTYVYQVRANDVGGRDLFKNNGLSEVCWFHYGYPEGGKVNLLFPENDHGYGISDRPYFRWSAPDLRLRNQPFVYEIKIVVLNDGQDLQQAIDTNPVWHTQTTSRTLFDRGMDVVIKKLLRRGLDYAWQVTAYSGNQTVAKSEVRKFKGPPIIDRFFAKTHIVTVKKATTKDSLNFSGVGRVRTGLRDSTDFTFEGLKLRRIGTLWVLTEGSLYNEMSNPVPIILQPRFEKNGTATFYPRAYKLDSRELAIEGEVQWQLPHPVKAGSSIVKSDRSWLNYDEYTLLGAARMSSQNQFDLLEPMDFQLQLSPKSDFLISGNKFELRAEGNLQLPEKIKGKQRGKVKVPFPRTSQLFYIENLNTTFDNDLRLVNNTRIYIHPTTVTIDLSEENSPGRQGANAFWKGVYVQSFELQYHSFTDQFSQLLFKKDLTQTFTGEEAAATNAWVDGLGLNFTLAKTFQNEAITFNSFAGRVQQLDLVIERNNLSSGTFRGGILLPVFSNTDLFSFTIPVTGEGFQPGFLNTLDGKTFVFNKDGGEQEVNLTVQRGVFEDQRVLNMTIDLEWPALGVKAAAVTNFRTWGDYRIGFYTPNGTRALDQHLSARMGGYPVTLDVIAAGSNSGIYSFAVSGKGELGDDVSGEKGPPTVNIFTLSPNSNLPKAAASQTSFSGTANSDQEVANVQSEYDGAQQEVTKKLELDQNEIKNAANATLANLTSSQAATSTVGDVLPQEGVATAQDPAANPKSGGLLARLSPKQREIVKDIIKTVVAELTKPLTKKIDDKAADVNNRIRTRINDMLKRDSVMVRDKVTSIVNAVAGKVMNATKNSKVDLTKQIEDLSLVVANSVANEVNRSIRASVDKNILLPVTSLIRDEVAGKINLYIRDASGQIVVRALEGELNLDNLPQAILSGLDSVMTGIAGSIFDRINFTSMSNMVVNTVNDAIKGIDTDKIVNEITAAAKAIAVNTLTEQANKLVAKQVSAFLNNKLGVDVPIDFTNLGKRILRGEKIFSLDSVAIKLRTKALELNGFVYHKRDQPIYGSVWMGNIDVLVKIPRHFSMNIIYLNGKTDGFSYWFAQIQPSSGQAVKLGDVMPKKARPLSTPINMGVASIVGVSGRVYHKMLDQPDKPIVPNAQNDYGAYLNMIFFDGRGGKTMRLDVAGEFNTQTNGDYVLTFEGNIQLMNESPKVDEIDPMAVAKGVFKFSYNSAEKHFLGYGRVEIKSTKLCATGSVLVDTKPGKWRVEIGNRNDRITFIPFCAGWSPTGWLAVTESEAELGLGVQYSVNAKTPTIWLFLFEVNVGVDAGLAFGVVVAVRYNPNFALLRAGIWADLWADIVVNYKSTLPFSKWKSFSLLKIYAQGDLLLTFEPKPSTLEGKLKGYVRLLGLFSVDFDAGFKKEI